MRVWEAIAAELHDHGVEVVFGLAGSDTVKIGARLEELGVRYVGARHESQAVMMADGYARVTGRLGVALASRGPGFTNTLTGLVCAAKACSPVVVIQGDSAYGTDEPTLRALQRAEPKHVDQDSVTRAAGVLSATVGFPQAARADLRAILERAELGATIAVHIPTDVLAAATGDGQQAGVDLPPPVRVPEPDPEAIAGLADLFESGWAARKPVILAGRGARRSEARPPLEELGERIGAVFATSLMNRSWFADSPWDIGVCGTLSTPVASELLVEADLALVFGASLNKFTTYDGTLLADAFLVQVDNDPGAFGRHGPEPDLAIHAEAEVVASALAAELERRDYAAEGFRTESNAERIREHSNADLFRDESTESALDPRSLMVRLDEMLPMDRIVVVEAGDHLRFSCKYLGVPDPSAFVFPMETFAIGLGMGAAIGAAIGDPSRLTILEIGDGGMMMTLGDLETAIREDIPMLIVISNNGGLGSEMKTLARAGIPQEHAMFPPPSFADVAQAMGAESQTIRTKEGLDLLSERLREPLDGPLVLDCHVTPKFDVD